MCQNSSKWSCLPYSGLTNLKTDRQFVLVGGVHKYVCVLSVCENMCIADISCVESTDV